MRFQIAQALAHFLWQGAAIAIVLWGLLRFLRDAGARYNACACALALMCISPVATFLWLAPRTSALQGTRGIMLNSALPAAGASSVNWFEANAAWMFWLWLTGALVLLVRAAVAWWRARTLVTRDFEAMPSNVELAARRLAVQLDAKRVQFRTSAKVASALVFGWLKPVVILPAAALGRLTEAEIEALLAHELAHVVRGDFLVNLLQTFAECVLFYHPLVWWVSARMREERELCCDDIAVAVCRDEVLYSRALLRLEEIRMEPALAATGGRLALRIRRLLIGCEAERMNVTPGFALVLLLGVSVALLAQAPPPEPPEPPTPVAAATAPDAPPAPPDTPPPPASAKSKPAYRVGADVTAPRLVHKVEPGYTDEAHDAGLEGTVVLSCIVSVEGTAADIKVVRSLDRGLDEQAIQAVRQWRFEPGRKKGQPVPVVVNIETNFRLLNDPPVPPVAAVPPLPEAPPAPAAAPMVRVTPVTHAAPMPHVSPMPSVSGAPPAPAAAPEPPAPPEPPSEFIDPPAPPTPPSNAVTGGVVGGVPGGVRKGPQGGVVGGVPGGGTRAQRAALEQERLGAEAEREAAAAELAETAKARHAAEAALREDLAKASATAQSNPESRKSVEEMRRKVKDLARIEAQSAKAEADKVSQEMKISAQVDQLVAEESLRARREASRASADADRLGQQAELQTQTARAAAARDAAELERRRRYAAERFGGENTDRGKVYLHYGPPDEIESHPSQGKGGTEVWRYKDASKHKIMLEIQFEGGKQIQRKGGFAADT